LQFNPHFNGLTKQLPVMFAGVFPKKLTSNFINLMGFVENRTT